jgi:hypothetical protein
MKKYFRFQAEDNAAYISGYEVAKNKTALLSELKENGYRKIKVEQVSEIRGEWGVRQGLTTQVKY